MRFIFLCQEMMYHFHHCRQIALLLEITRTHIDQVKQFIRIYQVKITGKCQAFTRHQIAFDKGVTEFNIVFALCSIPEMSE